MSLPKAPKVQVPAAAPPPPTADTPTLELGAVKVRNKSANRGLRALRIDLTRPVRGDSGTNVPSP